jgi:quercetin dioxygenase-like cupin family protein
VRAAMCGIRSTPEASAPRVFTSGLRPSAYRVADGRRIRIGTPIREDDDVSNECGEAVLESLAGSTAMPFIDTSTLEVIERLPGWYGRYFHSPSMTFAHYDFKSGSSIHEHFHPQEEVYEVIEGELELTIDGVKQVARPGLVGIVPSNVRHSVKALTDGRAIIVDYPLRTDAGERHS